VVLDNNDAARDREVAAHVLGQHRYRAPGADGADDRAALDPLDAGDGGDGRVDQNGEPAPTRVRVKYDARLYGARAPGKKEPLTGAFLRKYIAFAKARFAAPELTPEAGEAIAEYYADLRSSAEVRALPVTVRTLETLIRLASAHAKVRLSAYVEPADVGEATALMDLIMKSDPSAAEARRRAGGGAGAGAKRARGEGEEEEGGAAAPAPPGDGGEPAPETDDAEVAGAGAAPAGAPAGRGAIRAVVMELGQANAGAASVTGVLAELRARGAPAARAEVLAALAELEGEERILQEGEDFYLAS
jgi:DNA replication licensing factor MCM3